MARHTTQAHANKILMGNAGNIERSEVLKAGLQDAKMMRVMLVQWRHCLAPGCDKRIAGWKRI
jgi:hypothetical protein